MESVEVTTVESFQHQGHSCELRHHRSKGRRAEWLGGVERYLGVYWVFVNEHFVLITPSRQWATRHYRKAKTKIILQVCRTK